MSVRWCAVHRTYHSYGPCTLTVKSDDKARKELQDLVRELSRRLVR